MPPNSEPQHPISLGFNSCFGFSVPFFSEHICGWDVAILIVFQSIRISESASGLEVWRGAMLGTSECPNPTSFITNLLN